MSEINPRHPVVQATRDHWYKLLAAVLWKHRAQLPKEVLLTADDLQRLQEAFEGQMPCIVVHEKSDGLHLRVIPESEARRLAREHDRTA